MSEVGKAAKHMGVTHPRDLRRIDPVPERPTPKPKAKRKVETPFGYSFVYAGLMAWGRRKPPKVERKWFATVRQRDQAIKDLVKKNVHGFYKDILPITAEVGAKSVGATNDGEADGR
jgi:hypothetical protein